MRLGTPARGRNAARRGLPVPPTQRRPDGADHIYLPIQENSVPEWAAGELERTQFAPHKRQPVDRPGRGCPHGSQPAGPLPGQYDAGHLCPRLRQEEAGGPGKAGGSDGGVISLRRNY